MGGGDKPDVELCRHVDREGRKLCDMRREYVCIHKKIERQSWPLCAGLYVPRDLLVEEYRETTIVRRCQHDPSARPLWTLESEIIPHFEGGVINICLLGLA